MTEQQKPPGANQSPLLKQAYLALQEMQAKLDAVHQPEAVAVVGIGCRLPGGVDSAQAFWELLKDGRNTTVCVPSERWDIDEFFDPNPDVPGKMATRWGNFLEKIDEFDSSFFNIAPREAAGMDPQQRILLEVMWSALEDAGIAPDGLRGSRAGVFLGMTTGDYGQLEIQAGDPALLNAHFASGMAHSVASGRISYLLGLEGPSIALDTACSSSLVAIHLACQSLVSGESTMAIAGGVNLMLAPEVTIALSHSRMLAPDGRCKVFDAAADGFARGEGCGVVILKRLSDAQRNGDRIYAIVRGSAVNQDGASSSLTAPNGTAQVALIKEALRKAGLPASSVSYIESHGTGTVLGDPIELRALGEVYGSARASSAALTVGSVKTNIGHLEAAAGVTGFIKAVLCLRHAQIPPHLNFQVANPHVNWSKLNIQIPTSFAQWPAQETPRRAAVSAFGFSGTNAHIILEEGQAANSTVNNPGHHILAVSAKTPLALNNLVNKMHTALSSGGEEIGLEDFCFTANTGRSHFSYRRAFVAATKEELLRELGTAFPRQVGIAEEQNPCIGFCFSGEIHHVQLGQALYGQGGIYKTEIDRCALMLQKSAGISLQDILFGSSTSSVALSSYRGAALFAIEFAMSAVWRSWGIEPSFVAGDGVGEVVAACVAGILSVEEGFMLVLDPTHEDNSKIDHRSPRIPILANLTRVFVRGKGTFTPDYWTRSKHEQLSITTIVQYARNISCNLLLRIGATTDILTIDEVTDEMIRPALADHEQTENALIILKRLYEFGFAIQWNSVYRNNGRKITIPGYPFERVRAWFETRKYSRWPVAQSTSEAHPLLGARIHSPLSAMQWESMIGPDGSYLNDHIVAGQRILPAAAYVDMVLSAFKALGRPLPRLRGLRFHAPCIFDQIRRLQLILEDGEGPGSFKIYSLAVEASENEGGWTLHVSGETTSMETVNQVPPWNLEEIQKKLRGHLSGAEFYRSLERHNLSFGAAFKPITAVHSSLDEALAEIVLGPSVSEGTALYSIHPIALDACFQSAAAVALFAGSKGEEPYLPGTLESFSLLRNPEGLTHAYAILHKRTDRTVVADIYGFDARGNVLLIAVGMAFFAASRPTSAAALDREITPWLFSLEWIARTVTPPALASQARRMIGVSSRLDNLVRTQGIERYEQFLIALDSLCAAFIIKALRQMGFVPNKEASLPSAAMLDQAPILPRYRRLALRFLTIVEQNRISNHPDLEPESEVTRLTAQFPFAAAHLQWVLRTGRCLAGLLQGQHDPLELLYGDGGTVIASSIYRDSPIAQVVNTLVAESILNVVSAFSGERPIRILEVGAGTGATTSYLAPLLCRSGANVEYTWTDISPTFVAAARTHFGENSFFRFQTFDLEATSGLPHSELGCFDVILAVNVVHATKDILESMKHLHTLMQPQGSLFLVESTKPQSWFDLTVGFTDGWWRFNDPSLRKDYPLIDRAAWLAVLGQAGFATVDVVPTQENSSDALAGQAIFMAAATASSDTVDKALSRRVLLVYSTGSKEENAEVIAFRCRLELERISFDAADLGPGQSLADVGIQLTQAERQPSRRSFSDIFYFADSRGLGPCHLSADALMAMEQQILAPAMSLVREIASQQTAGTPRLWMVTKGSQGADATAPHQATLTGFSRAVAAEYPNIRCCSVDLDPARENNEEQLWGLLCSDERAVSVMLRGGETLEPRLSRLSVSRSEDQKQSVVSGPRYAVRAGSSGTLEGIQWVAARQLSVSDEEVEIEVHASGMNFREVVSVLGICHGTAAPLGGECSGIVVRVGKDVSHVSRGDEVVAIASGCFSNTVVARASMVWPKPRRMSFASAATIPIAFLTASHCLFEVCALESGQSILIHAGAGAVGHAAIQLAINHGVTVFATAGSESKRKYLRSLPLAGVMDSRSTVFASQIIELTNGRGVDLVLNSLTGPAIAAGMRCLAAGGCFVELGHTEVWSQERVQRVRGDILYYPIDLSSDLMAGRKETSDAVSVMVEKMGSGELEPLPWTAFAMEEPQKAFRFMAQAKQIGKVLLVPKLPKPNALVREDGAYMITGGLSGIGLCVAEWLSEKGAGRIILMGRNAANAEACEAVDRMRQRGTDVVYSLGDVGQAADVVATLKAVGDLPLRGVFHCAGVLHNALLSDQSWESFHSVLSPKIAGAWNLHTLTRHYPLDHFVLFSSIASITGSAGQTNHSAANAFLDAFAHYRRALGLPACTINWGPWSEIGAAVRHNVLDSLGSIGLSSIAPQQGLQILELALSESWSQSVALPIDIDKLRRDGQRQRELTRLLADLLSESQPAASCLQEKPDSSLSPPSAWLIELQGAPPASRRFLLTQFLETTVRSILSLRPSQPIDARRPLQELGLDSLLSVEMRAALSTSLGRNLSSTLLFDYPTLNTLADYLLAELQLEAAPHNPAADAPRDLLRNIENLSDEEVDRLFADQS